MADDKKVRRKPTRQQPRRATREAGQNNKANVRSDATPRPPTGGVHKHEGKTRVSAARKRKKHQRALVRRVDSRDPEEAFAEQAQLLGLSDPASPESAGILATPPPSPKSRSLDAKGSQRYMDDIIPGVEGDSESSGGGDGDDDDYDDEYQRQKRWIPNFCHRTRPMHKPPGVPYSLWMTYIHLDDYIYRCSLSPTEVKALPLLEDVYEYQNNDGRTPKPITPPGYRFDENLELVPVEN